MPIFAIPSSSVAFFSPQWTDVHTHARNTSYVRARHTAVSKICPGYVQERAFLRVRALQVRLVERFSEYGVLDGRLHIRCGHGHLLVRDEVRYHVRHEDIIMVVSSLDVTI